MPKTMRVQRDGRVGETMSFKTFDFIALSREDCWEESELYSLLAPTKFLFVIFREREDGEYALERVRFWNMPNSDLDEARRVWERTVRILREGVRLERTPQGGRNNLPKRGESPVAHVRPHGRNAADTLPLPDGREMTKQCFWLNNTYIEKQLKSR